jgi:RNA polymerase sigma factor (TIGR02999 family)
MSSAQVTQLIGHAAAGDRGAVDVLATELYSRLHGLAAKLLLREDSDCELNPTDLVHEAYMKLVGQRRVDWRGRTHFRAIAARMMRRVLIDHARGHKRLKRGGETRTVSLVGPGDPGTGPRTDLVALDEALEELADLNRTQAQLVELRFFGGLTVEETAEALGLSLRSAQREWTMTKAWLKRRLERRQPP